eukprot:jgi/Phyca11/103108/e_gw1.7.539.1
MSLEDKVRLHFPCLLQSGVGLTKDSWVLDSGCGFGLTGDASKFVTKRPDTGYTFTFAQGSKHSNTHLGTVKLYFFGPDGIRPFLFENIALVPHAKSNILSEYWLKREGYQIVGSLTGEYKFVLYENSLWHVKLGHLNKDTVIDMLSKKMVEGMPTLPRSELRKVPFFCTTCTEMKKRRMSYRNSKGSRDEHPISTIHMDTNGPMKTMGIYGSVG